MRFRFYVPVVGTALPLKLTIVDVRVVNRSLLAAQAAVPRHEMAVVTGVRNFVRLFGSTIALAICASIVNNTLRTEIEPFGLSAEQIDALVDDPTIINDPSKIDLSEEAKRIVIAGYTKGFRSVFFLTLASTLIAFLSAVLCVEQHELNREDDQELKRQGKEFIKQMKSRGAGKDLEIGDVEKQDGKDTADEVADTKEKTSMCTDDHHNIDDMWQSRIDRPPVAHPKS